jgi:A nuclease family of the HNH/ENDO VII superfamily with conserved AHH
MTQVAQPIAVVVTTQPGKGQKCDWSNCLSDHPSTLNYPNSGTLARSGGFRDDCANIGLQPWQNGSHGEPTKPIYLVTGKIKRNAAGGTPFTDYRWEAHHLIPVEQMDKTGTLKDNAKLAGYNINHVKNGMGLPTDKIDIAIHRLQRHKGSHCGKYTNPVSLKLQKIEKAYEKACQGTTDTSLQLTLIIDLDALSRTAEQKVVAIRQQVSGACWELHTDSMTLYKWALTEYDRRKQKHVKLPPGKR